MVGAALTQDVGDYGYVRQLAVAPSQRGRGVGLALLHESFARHRARALPATALGVDAANPTGALALYERAGMRVVEQFTRWDRPAPHPPWPGRPGRPGRKDRPDRQGRLGRPVRRQPSRDRPAHRASVDRKVRRGCSCSSWRR